MTFRTVTKRATFLSLFLGILLASSVAFAWWTASGVRQRIHEGRDGLRADDGRCVGEHDRPAAPGRDVRRDPAHQQCEQLRGHRHQHQQRRRRDRVRQRDMRQCRRPVHWKRREFHEPERFVGRRQGRGGRTGPSTSPLRAPRRWRTPPLRATTRAKGRRSRSPSPWSATARSTSDLLTLSGGRGHAPRPPTRPSVVVNLCTGRSEQP